MYFTHFSFLYTLGALLILIGVFFLLFFKNKGHTLYRTQKISSITLMISIMLTLCALFGPRYQPFLKDSDSSPHQNRAFVIDVSESMNTFDMADDSTTRLDVVKSFISQLIQSSPNHNYALNVFAGGGRRILPFTEDGALFQNFLSNISSSDVLKSGTDIQRAFEIGLSNFMTSSGGTIIIFTDGGEKTEILDYYKKQFQTQDIQLVMVGVGSDTGGYIPIGIGNSGEIQYKMYKGQKVITKRESKLLQEITLQFKGKYFEIGKKDDIYALLKSFEYIGKYPQKTKDIHDREGSLVFIFVCFSSILFCISVYFQLRVLGKGS